MTMAIEAITTNLGKQKTCFSSSSGQKYTPCSFAFSTLLNNFKAMNTAEVRIETAGFDVLGLEMLQELRVAERAREATIEAAFDVIAAPDASLEDRDLRRLAVLLTAIFQTVDDVECQRLLAQCNHHRDIFDVVVAGPDALHARRLHTRFFQQLDTLTALQEFGGADLDNELWPDFPDLAPA
jgi:hypothetical protein